MAQAPSLTTAMIKNMIPQSYQFISTLSRGGFGQVVKCKVKGISKPIAVKLPLFQQDNSKEIRLMTELKKEDQDKTHIVKFFDFYLTPLGCALVFEMLDMSLYEYMMKHKPMALSDIRIIVQQMAMALKCLKKHSIIHMDLKLDNIMLNLSPPQVKVIDFGMATKTKEVKPERSFHQVCYRPPENILGLSLDEAVDVWCLGNIMAILLLRFEIFPNQTEYEALKVMLKLLGQPSDCLLSKGFKTHNFFNFVHGSWKFKTEMEYRVKTGWVAMTYPVERYSSVQELVQDQFQLRGLQVDKNLLAATDLITRMLEVNAPNRITPEGILLHPFIQPLSKDRGRGSSAKPCSGIAVEVKPTSAEVQPADNKEHVEEHTVCIDKPLTTEEIKEVLPEHYKLLKVLGDGHFGQVVKCRQLDTRKIVSLKLPYSNNRTVREILILDKLARREGTHDIVKIIDIVDTSRGQALVLEQLNMSLCDYMMAHAPLPLSDIQAIIQQTATALHALKSNRLIHGGVMVENIWLCSHKNQPPKIRLADFGSAVRRKKAVPGMTVQQVHYRAPEIILGLPFNEAIDVWSLGCMMVHMLMMSSMFPSQTEYETLKTMITFFGHPPDHMIREALKTSQFFKAAGDSWKIMTRKEFEVSSDLPRGTIQAYNTDTYRSLDRMIEAYIDRTGHYDQIELLDFMDLLKRMLTMDWPQRITPAQILTHPFICEEIKMEKPAQTEPIQQEDPSTQRVATPLPVPPVILSPLLEDNQQSDSVEREVGEPALAEPVQKEPPSTQRFFRPLPPLPSPLQNSRPKKKRKKKKKVVENTMSQEDDNPRPFHVGSLTTVFGPRKAITVPKKNCFQRVFSWMRKHLGFSS